MARSWILLKMARVFAACGLSAWAMLVCTGTAKADLIDFETGFSGLEAVGTIVTPSNAVTFSVGSSTIGPGAGPGFVAGVGDLPGVAFDGTAGIDSVITPSVAGSYFLTDEFLPAPSNELELNYFLEFATPVTSISLNLYRPWHYGFHRLAA